MHNTQHKSIYFIFNQSVTRGRCSVLECMSLRARDERGAKVVRGGTREHEA